MAARFAEQRLVDELAREHRAARRLRDATIDDRVRLSRAGRAEGRHGPGAGRGVPDLPRDVRRGRRGARRVAERAVLRRARRIGCCSPRTRSRRSSPSASPRAGWSNRAACAPSFAAGHSLGEYSAHVAAGTLSFADALRTVRRRGRYMQEAVPVGEGAMAAILGLDEAGVGARLRGGRASVPDGRVAGQPERAGAGRDRRARAMRWRAPASAAKALGAKRVIPLPVSAPFHCALMKPAEERLAPELRALPRQRSADAGRRQRRRRAEARRRRVDRGADSPGLVAGALGRRRAAGLSPDGVTHVRRAGPGHGAGGLDPEDRSAACRVVEHQRGRRSARASRRCRETARG